MLLKNAEYFFGVGEVGDAGSSVQSGAVTAEETPRDDSSADNTRNIG